MASLPPLSAEELGFLEAYLPQDREGDLPFVTLTWASSLDGMIAVAPGARTTLSGPESKSMTHYLRMHHDAILVGATTAKTDDPGLNCRYPGATLDQQPRPVIVDPNARFYPRGTKVYAVAGQGDGKAPWIVVRPTPSAIPSDEPESCEIEEWDPMDPYNAWRRRETSNSYLRGATIPWECILQTLKKNGINSVMIEGGATVINSLLSQPCLVDRIIITMAPTFLGQGGVSVAPRKPPSSRNDNAAWIDDTKSRQFGNDVVLVGNPRRPPPYQ